MAVALADDGQGTSWTTTTTTLLLWLMMILLLIVRLFIYEDGMLASSLPWCCWGVPVAAASMVELCFPFREEKLVAPLIAHTG